MRQAQQRRRAPSNRRATSYRYELVALTRTLTVSLSLKSLQGVASPLASLDLQQMLLGAGRDIHSQVFQIYPDPWRRRRPLGCVLGTSFPILYLATSHSSAVPLFS